MQKWANGLSSQQGKKRQNRGSRQTLFGIKNGFDLWVNLAGFQQRDCLLSDIDND